MVMHATVDECISTGWQVIQYTHANVTVLHIHRFIQYVILLFPT